MMTNKRYVYILRSLKDQEKIYVGMTCDINRRLSEHNSETQVYSKRYAPWQLVTYVVFSNDSSAASFEKHLKTPSGKAFIKKHLL